MNFFTTLFTIFVSLYAYGADTTTLAFSPISSSNNYQRSLATASHSKKGTQLNYLREVEMHGVTLAFDSNTVEQTVSKDNNCLKLEDEDGSIDLMEEGFNNMQHPMELMLLSRACIPYVAENRIAENKATMESLKTVEHKDEDDDFIDHMEKDFDNMQHHMELMLLNRACIPYVAM